MKKLPIRIAAFFLAASALFAVTASCPSLAADTSRKINGGGNTGFSTTEKELLDLGLSVMYLDTEDGDYITSRLEYKNAKMTIVLSDEYKLFTNEFTSEGGGAVRLKGRGNSTWNNGYKDGKANTLSGDTHTRKVPYNLKLDKKTDLFGMGGAKNWVLVANYMDRTFLRNKIIYELSGQLGMVYTKSVFVNVVLNGEYMGVYMLCQKINANLFDGDVVDWDDVAQDVASAIAEKDGLDDARREQLKEELETNVGWITSGVYGKYKISDYIDISEYYPYTGLLLEYDGYADEASFFTTGHGVPIKVKNLEYIKTNEDMFSYLTSYLYYFEEALYSDTFCNSAGKHYSEYLDMDSFVDYFILNMVMLNVEFGYKSMFMYINDYGKLVLGPCWDYDWSSGNPFLNSNAQYDQWYNDGRAGNNHWYHQIYCDPWFVALVRERWAQILDEVYGIIDMLESYSEYLEPTVKLENKKFAGDPYESDFAWRTGGRAYSVEVNVLSNLLQNRIDWMNVQLSERDPDIENRGFRSKYSFEITVTGKSSDIAGPDPDEQFYVADGISEEFQDVTVKTSMENGDNVKIYLNGNLLKDKTITSANGTVTQLISANQFMNGVNVITVMRNTWESDADVVYYSLQMPGVKDTISSVGEKIIRSGENDETDEPEEPQEPGENIGELVPDRIKPEDDGAITVLTIVIPAAAVAISLIAIVFALVYVKKKRSLSPHKIDPSAQSGGLLFTEEGIRLTEQDVFFKWCRSAPEGEKKKEQFDDISAFDRVRCSVSITTVDGKAFASGITVKGNKDKEEYLASYKKIEKSLDGIFGSPVKKRGASASNLSSTRRADGITVIHNLVDHFGFSETIMIHTSDDRY